MKSKKEEIEKETNARFVENDSGDNYGKFLELAKQVIAVKTKPVLMPKKG